MNDHEKGSAAGDDARGAARQDIQATAESIRADSHRLAAVEDEKLALEPEDPAVDRLSARAAELADGIARKAHLELQLSDEIG